MSKWIITPCNHLNFDPGKVKAALWILEPQWLKYSPIYLKYYNNFQKIIAKAYHTYVYKSSFNICNVLEFTYCAPVLLVLISKCHLPRPWFGGGHHFVSHHLKPSTVFKQTWKRSQGVVERHMSQLRKLFALRKHLAVLHCCCLFMIFFHFLALLVFFQR